MSYPQSKYTAPTQSENPWGEVSVWEGMPYK